MNKIEEIVYHLLRNKPGLKFFIRNLYQDIYDLFPVEETLLPESYNLKKGYFFGFHDLSPFSEDESMILANKTMIDFRMPTNKDALGVGYFDFKEGMIGDYHELSHSYSWNYHKGCRLQWISKKEFIYNTALDDSLVSEIIDVSSCKRRIIPHAIDTVFESKTESIATSFSYERLERFMPCYGYRYQDNSFLKEQYPNRTGLFLINLKTGKSELIVSINDIVELMCIDGKDNYFHYITHTEFSKDGRYLSFLYRKSKIGENNYKRHTNIMVLDRKNGHIFPLPTQDSGSHYIWNEANQIIASCIINDKMCHVLYDMENINDYTIVAPNILNQDGHQFFINNFEFITDTYPDKRRYAQIYRVNLKTNTVQLLANLKSPKQFQFRDYDNYIDCDLHPRVSSSGEYVCCDTVFPGERSLMVFKI